jgi:hypothetical protein
LVLRLIEPPVAPSEADEERRKKVLAFVREHGPVSKNKVENGRGNRDAVRRTLKALVAEGLLVESLRGQAKLYSTPRPDTPGEVRARYPPAQADRPSLRGGDTPVGGLPLGEVGDASPTALAPERQANSATLSLEAAFGGPGGAVAAMVREFDAVELVEADAPCRIANHAGAFWRAGDGPVACGACHPPAPGVEASRVGVVASEDRGTGWEAA